MNIQLWSWRDLEVTNVHERDPKEYIKGIKETVAAVEAGRLNPEKLYTHTYTLQEIAKAFRYLTSRPNGFVIGLISYEI